MFYSKTARFAGLLAALTMTVGLIAPASAQVDIAVKGVCPGIWVTMPSASYETVKVCKREAVAPVRHASIRKHDAKPAAKQARAARPVQAPVQLAFVSRGDDRECVALTCPHFLLTGVGY